MMAAGLQAVGSVSAGSVIRPSALRRTPPPSGRSAWGGRHSLTHTAGSRMQEIVRPVSPDGGNGPTEPPPPPPPLDTSSGGSRGGGASSSNVTWVVAARRWVAEHLMEGMAASIVGGIGVVYAEIKGLRSEMIDRFNKVDDRLWEPQGKRSGRDLPASSGPSAGSDTCAP